MKRDVPAPVLWWLGAAILYATLTFFLTLPLPLAPASLLAPDPIDPVLNTWILWWDAHALPLTSKWWTGLAFYPQSGGVALSEHLLGLTPISTPLIWISGSPILAYNVLFLLSFPLSALGAHLLVHRMTSRHGIALVAGLLYGFHPYRVSQLSHLQVISSYGMPVALYGLHRYLENRERKWLVLFGGAWLFQSLSNGYFLFYFSILVALWLAFWIRTWKDARAIGLAWILAALPLVPILLQYKTVQERLGLARTVAEIETYSADILAVTCASGLLQFTKLPPIADRAEGQLFPGIVCILLVVLGWRKARRPELAETRWGAGIHRLSLAIAGLLVLATLSVLLWGPWSLTLLGIRVAAPDSLRPLTQAAVFFLLALVTTRRFVASVRQRSGAAFYLSAAFALWLLALGPTPHLLGVQALQAGPYAALMKLPGFSGLRVPPRLAMPMFLCLAVASALFFDKVLRDRGRRARALWTTAVASGVVLESWIGVLPVVSPPPVFDLPSTPSRVDAVLELPLGRKEEDVAALYRTTHHGTPVVNGLSGYDPPHYGALRLAFRESDESVWPAMRGWGNLLVVVDERRHPELAREVEGLPQVQRLGARYDRVFYYLPKHAVAERCDLGFRVRVKRMFDDRGLVNLDVVSDRDRVTRWHTGKPQTGGETVILDLGEAHRPSGLTMELGVYLNDFPRALEVEARPERGPWRVLWRGRTAGLALSGAVDSPRDIPLRLSLDEVEARYIRLTQWGVGPPYHWSFSEIEVFERQKRR